MKPYRYRPLKDGQFTRILHLHPARDHNAPLRCDIVHRRNNSRVPYEALSYAWGHPIFTGTLFCNSNEKYLKITPSLEDALRALRFQGSTKKRMLWVDAVCINQEDIDEKSKQVQIMSEIYSEAKRVCAWVGDDADDGSKVLAFLDEHSDEIRQIDQLHEIETGNRDHSYIATIATSIERKIRETFGVQGLEPFRKFFLRPWFQRRWIIQEAGLAKRSLICCGGVSTSLTTFALAALAMDILPDLKNLQHPLEPHFLMNTNTNENLLGLTSTQSEGRFYEALKGRKGRDQLDESRFPILHLLHTFYSAQCSDDRDRVYALLGLSDDVIPKQTDKSAARKRRRKAAVQVPVNYEHGVEQVYKSLAMKVVATDSPKHGAVNQLLHCAGAFKCMNSTSDLPTWVPDWRAPRHFQAILPSRWIKSEFSVSLDGRKDHRTSRQVSPDMEALYLEGWSYSKISEKAAGNFPARILRYQQLKEITERLWKFSNPTDSEGVGYENFFELIAMGRFLLESISENVNSSKNFVDMILNESPTPVHARGHKSVHLVASSAIHNHHQRTMAEGIDSLITSPEFPTFKTLLQMREYVRNLILYLEGRWIFRGTKGELMNCPDDAEVGDTVAIFKGMDTPFVIRPTGLASPTAVGKLQSYTLVGNCYVDGIMKKSGVRQNQLGEILQFKVI